MAATCSFRVFVLTLIASTLGICGTADACPTVVIVSDPDPPTNIRSGPSVSTAILTTLPNGQPIAIDGHHGGWAHIASPIVGYISANLTMTTTPPCHSPDTHTDSIIKDAIRGTVHSQEFWNAFWRAIGIFMP